MNYRLTSLLALASDVGDVTKTIDINLTDPISEILIQADPYTNFPSAGPDAHPIDVLEKVEILDGSDVLLSLDGYQLHALDIYNRDRQRNPWYMYLDNNRMDMPVGINFGRWLWDPELAFDPTKFNNPQLKITIDESGAKGTFESVNLQVDAAVFDEKTISPRGFLMAKELKEYTMGSADHEYTTMPTDYVYRKMFVQTLTEGSEPNQQFNTLKLSEEHDKKLPFNGVGFDDLLRMIAYQHPPVREGIYQYCGSSATEGFCTPTTRVHGAVTEWHAGAASDMLAFYDGDGGRFHIIAATTGGNVNLLVDGYLPHGVYEIPFGLPNEIEDWYDVTPLGSLELDILSKAAGSTKTAKIFLEQLRTY